MGAHEDFLEDIIDGADGIEVLLRKTYKISSFFDIPDNKYAIYILQECFYLSFSKKMSC